MIKCQIHCLLRCEGFYDQLIDVWSWPVTCFFQIVQNRRQKFKKANVFFCTIVLSLSCWQSIKWYVSIKCSTATRPFKNISKWIATVMPRAFRSNFKYRSSNRMFNWSYRYYSEICLKKIILFTNLNTTLFWRALLLGDLMAYSNPAAWVLLRPHSPY